jgi:hypothetical protein
MRYARKHTYATTNDQGEPATEVRLIDVVDIPTNLPAWANGEPLEFLAKMYPNISSAEFAQVADDARVGDPG